MTRCKKELTDILLHIAQIISCVCLLWASLVGSVIKNLPANAGDLGVIPGETSWKRKWLPTHSSILVWKNPRRRSLAGFVWG